MSDCFQHLWFATYGENKNSSGHIPHDQWLTLYMQKQLCGEHEIFSEEKILAKHIESTKCSRVKSRPQFQILPHQALTYKLNGAYNLNIKSKTLSATWCQWPTIILYIIYSLTR